MDKVDSASRVHELLEDLPSDHRTPVAVAILSRSEPASWVPIAESVMRMWTGGEWHVDAHMPDWYRAMQLADLMTIVFRRPNN